MLSRQPRLILFWLLATVLAGCARLTTAGTMETSAPNGAIERIPVAITRPAGPGPFPRW